MSAAKKQPRVQRKEQTRSITYRLPAKLVEELETEAAQRRISQNVLVRQIIESYMQWGRYSDKIGVVPVPKGMLRRALNDVNFWHQTELIVWQRKTRMEPGRKKKAKLIILLAVIWFVITLPLPFIINNPDIPEKQYYTIMGIIAIMSVPFVVLGVVWTLRPELTKEKA